MGEAKRRAIEASWFQDLTADEQKVVLLARRLITVLPMQGACYQTTFFMKYHLETVHGIVGLPVVGFVNDGTDDMYPSHAWYEYNGQKTDITLARPFQPHLQPPGPITIHGRVVRSGNPYTYHAERPPEGDELIARYLQDPESRPIMEHAAARHAEMTETAKDNSLIRTYLDNAPNGMTYDRIVQRL
ncbi:hypothetical protein ACQKQD_04995 [Methylobacterium sp. NPDC080182]|uniref:hypothetical protein n=1 Tax=Methylobacterium sp. NPDC080182 TaxID=3390590 RepID=UPI003CFC021A